MATVNIGDDFKQYLASSGTSNGNRFLNIFKFNGSEKVSNWIYSPLSTNENGDDADEQSDNVEITDRCKCLQDFFPTLTRTQRIIGFAIFLMMGSICLILASLYIPVLILKARKFALLFTLGSIFFVMSFAFLSGPCNHMQHLFSKDRFLFTASYFASLISTLYVSLSLQSTFLTLIFGLLQVIALVWYLFSYLPGGQKGLTFFSKIVSKAATRNLPI